MPPAVNVLPALRWAARMSVAVSVDLVMSLSLRVREPLVDNL
jgi:hypothetical protein